MTIWGLFGVETKWSPYKKKVEKSRELNSYWKGITN